MSKVEITPEQITAAMMLLNTLIQLAVRQYETTGQIPTVAELLAANAATQAKIDAEKV